MKNLYLVTLDARLDREAIIKHISSLKGYGTWFYSMPGSFFVYSSLAAKEIGDAISNFSGGDFRYFVTCVSGANYIGWMPKTHWEIVNNCGAEKRYDLEFKGYYNNKERMPRTSGVYCVYSGVLDVDTNLVQLSGLLYSGKALNIYDSLRDPEHQNEWVAEIKGGQELWYTYAEVLPESLDRCGASLIYLNRPKCNHKGLDSFHYYDTYISVTGAVAWLKNNQVVEQTK